MLGTTCKYAEKLIMSAGEEGTWGWGGRIIRRFFLKNDFPSVVLVFNPI